MPGRAISLEAPYRRSAEIYDRVYAWKDYRAEARRVRQLVRRYGPPDARRLLDVACGTGEHLRYLGRWYEVTGLDSNPHMLAIARRKVPGARFVRATMQTYRFAEEFDAITCLFSAIGYVRSRADLDRTLRNFARHLAPGGVLLVEPWLAPSNYRVGAVHLQNYGTAESPIARMNTSERRGDRSLMDMHYLALDRGRIRHWVERHELVLFTDSTMRDAFLRAGLRVRRVRSRFASERGLYVGVRPSARPRVSARAFRRSATRRRRSRPSGP